jgi:hypothetical protein
MLTLLSEWTMERVSQLAPDTQSVQLGQQLANEHDTAWQQFARDGLRAWGLYKGTGSSAYQVKVDLLRIREGEHAWDCNCRSRKSPCKHVLGLLYRLVKASDTVSEEDVPEWFSVWHVKLENKSHRNVDSENKRELSPDQKRQRQATYEKRKQNIADGLEELEQWLINLIRRGLADPQVRSYEFWDGRAARMVDAQAPGIANWLRDMGSIPAQGTDWIEPLLDQLGRLYLLIESFKRIDELTAETQADIRTVLGWYMKQDEVLDSGGEVLEDTWLVVGRYMGDMRESLRTQRVWLRGKHSGRDALIIEFVFDNKSHFELKTAPGWAFDAKMMFYPSRYPLRAFVVDRYSDDFASSPILGMSIEENIEHYAHALTHNPWLSQFPFLLDNVIPVRQDNKWLVREIDGTYLLISESFAHKWSLLSLSGGHPLQIAGEWDGTELHPTGALEHERFVDFALIGKI